MGGSSSPVKSIVKAVEDTAQTVGKGFKDTVDTGIKAANDLGADDFIKANTDLYNEAKDKFEGGSIILSPTNAAEEAAKDDARKSAAQQEAAMRQQEKDAQDQLRTNAANRSANEGSSIILGNKRKKKKGSSVSSGMGLSKGDTGLQV